MRRLIQTAAVMMICAAMCSPQLSARGRNDFNKGNNGHKTEQQRPGNNGHHNNHNSSKPNVGKPNAGVPNHGVPNHGMQNHGPNVGMQHSNNGHGHNHFQPTPPPHRPMMPAHNTWHRPTPPPHYRPVAGWRPIQSILGVALGSAINFTVNQLINAGYAVSGYGNNAVYVSNVPMLNYMWPDATLYYTNGGLYASEFVYSTPGYDTNRYYRVYNSLCQNYGQPLQVVNNGVTMSATWWGTGGQFIRLNFNNGIAANGYNRYFTTLSFGN